jgi:glutathione S-transferase
LGRKKIIPYPSDAKELARIDEFLQYHHNSLMVTTGKLFYDTWVKPFTNITTPPHGMMMNVGHPKDFVILSQSLNDLERIWLSGSQKFLISDEATFADLIAACEISQITDLKLYEIDAKKYPKVDNWLANVKKEFNPEYDFAHKKICRVGEKYGGKPSFIGIALFKILSYYNKLRKLLKSKK